MLLAADLVDLLSLPVVQRSAVALVVAGTFLPLIGVLIIGFDILTVRFAVMHVALLGLALGLWIGVDPLLFALVTCGLAGLGLALLAARPGGLSGPMGFVMTVTIAAALLVLSVSGVNANSAFALLWGTILATRPADLALLVVLAVLVLGWYRHQRDHLALLLFDREVAATAGIAVGALTAAALVAISLSIAASIRLTGALLIDSLTILPALAARNLASSLRTMVRLSIAIGIAGNLLGLLVALILDQPPGPVLVLVAGAITTITYLKKDTPDAPAIH